MRNPGLDMGRFHRGAHMHPRKDDTLPSPKVLLRAALRGHRHHGKTVRPPCINVGAQRCMWRHTNMGTHWIANGVARLTTSPERRIVRRPISDSCGRAHNGACQGPSGKLRAGTEAGDTPGAPGGNGPTISKPSTAAYARPHEIYTHHPRLSSGIPAVHTQQRRCAVPLSSLGRGGTMRTIAANVGAPALAPVSGTAAVPPPRCLRLHRRPATRKSEFRPCHLCLAPPRRHPRRRWLPRLPATPDCRRRPRRTAARCG